MKMKINALHTSAYVSLTCKNLTLILIRASVDRTADLLQQRISDKRLETGDLFDFGHLNTT